MTRDSQAALVALYRQLVIPGRIEDANPESRASPMCNCTSEVRGSDAPE
jgi:hypothetical protein